MSLRVLVVDDEVRVADTLQAYLEDEGMEVRSAGSAEEALALIEAGTDFDVCIMDIRLPGMDGDAAILHLHRMRPHMRYIIHTGTASYGVPDDLRALGIDNGQCFMKPLRDMAPLVQTIRSLGTPG
jgi:two-component system OmpR family response regulator